MPVFSLVLWVALVWGAGWLSFPLARRVFEGALPDAGLSVGRILFLTLWTLAAFWLGNVGAPIAWSAALYVPMALGGLAWWMKERRELVTLIRQKRRAMVSVEAVFLLVFLLFFVLRGFRSSTDGTDGEKGMDSALIATLTRAKRLPPPNPYAAGTRLQSYYYGGHLGAALLTRASFTHTRWSYNWMCATLPALCFAALFAFGAALTGSLRGGAFVVASVLGLGTLQPLYTWMHPTPISEQSFLRLSYFTVSRVIPHTINEFPWFTFQQADLHAHYFSFPLQLALLALGWSLWRRFSRLATILTGLVLGALLLTNTWDFPIYALLLALLVGFAGGAQRVPAARWVGTGLVILGVALGVTVPFWWHLKSAATGPQWLDQPASPLREWLLVWGPLLGAWWLFAARFILNGHLSWARVGLAGGVFAGAMGWGFAAWGQPSWFVLPFIAASLLLALVGIARLRDEMRFLCLLAFVGLLALAWSETTWTGFLLPPNHRQDTVFKFGLQCWFLWGIAGAAGVWKVGQQVSCGKRIAIGMVAAPFAVVMLAASTSALYGRAYGFQRVQGGDGWATLATPEKQAAAWLEANAREGDFLVEAVPGRSSDFSASPRYCNATGIPVLVGPHGHSFYWAPANSGDIVREWTAVINREIALHRIYEGFNAREQWQLLKRYHVRFIVWGELERREVGYPTLGSIGASHLRVRASFGANTDPHSVQILEFVP